MKKDSSAKDATGFGLEFEYFNHGHEERYKQKTPQTESTTWRDVKSMIGKRLILA